MCFPKWIPPTVFCLGSELGIRHDSLKGALNQCDSAIGQHVLLCGVCMLVCVHMCVCAPMCEYACGGEVNVDLLYPQHYLLLDRVWH